ncbi:zinc-ribbon domain-containing protein [Lutibacter sp.]|uniref:zinc ribbon domain-containing protein n=1 Tax=Lutibacter sp. TaxID=1925666 RepID=UPI0034A058C0
MKYCTNCGQKLSEGSKFCTSCGAKVEVTLVKNETLEVTKPSLENEEISMLDKKDVSLINKKIELENSQTSIVKKFWYATAFFAFIIVLAFMDLDVLPIHPAIAFISFFLLVSSIVIAFMFRSREKKLQSLITGENLIASWKLNSEEKSQYVNFLFQNEKSRNMSIFIVTTILIIIIFGAFIIFIDEGKVAMFFIMLGLIAFIALFAFGMPHYYKQQNSKNDGKILIGKNYAYINGYFHNWDFILSGIKKAKIIDKPFYGLYIKYYYTDRTLTNTEELNIPASQNVNLQKVVDVLTS